MPRHRLDIVRSACLTAVAMSLAAGVACVPKPAPPPPVVEESPYPDDFACEEGTLPVGMPPPIGKIIWCQMQTATGHVLRHGPSIEWHDNGKRFKQGSYTSGKMDGAWSEWHATGDLNKDITYVNGVMEGPFIEYFLDGSKQAEGQMVNDKESGEWTYWTEGTGARLVGAFVEGKRSGTWLQYNADGVPVRERSYRAGRLTSQRELVPTEAPGVPSIQVHSTSTPAPSTDEDLLEAEPEAEEDLELPDDISELPEADDAGDGEAPEEPPAEASPAEEPPTEEPPAEAAADEPEPDGDDGTMTRPDDDGADAE